MNMRITAPCEVNGQPHDVGEIVDVTELGEAARLKHYGQAVPADKPTQDKKPGRPNIPPPPAPEHKEQ